MKNWKQYTLYIIFFVFAIVLIGVAFCNPKCENWGLWQTILISVGAGILSAILLAFFLFLIEQSKNHNIFLIYISNIRAEILFLYEIWLNIIEQWQGEACIPNQFENIKAVNSFVIGELKNISDILTPVSTSENGVSTNDDMEFLNKQKTLNGIIDHNFYFSITNKRFAEYCDNLKRDKMLLMSKYTDIESYNNLIKMLNVLSFDSIYLSSSNSAETYLKKFKSLDDILCNKVMLNINLSKPLQYKNKRLL